MSKPTVSGSNASKIGSGSMVVLSFEGDGAATTVATAILVDDKANEVMNVYLESPLGQALVGHAPGDTVDYMVPSGKVKQVTIVSLLK